ncbi:MAG: PAS domain-containing protein [Proteobacteria bacterium]|nr:PAS domain-containing protein [Pseudomonadota bacterium]MBU1596304.1 PAS domain-containing protein [Pseudomonadota bacterium]
MRLISRLNFQTKIVLGIFLIVVAVALMTAIPVSRMASRAILAESRGRGLVLAENLSLRLADAMLTQDFLRMKNMVDELTGVGEDILYAFVLDEAGDVLAHTFQKGFPVGLKAANAPGPQGARTQLLDTGSGLVDDFAVPVVISGKRFGTARLGLSRARAEAEVRRLMLTFAGLSVAALAAALALSSVFARRVARRINALKEYAQEVVRGNLDIETASTLKKNCWEIMDCGRTQCPAFGMPRHRCWHMQGTLCPDCAPADSQGRKACARCPVFRENAGDEIQDLAETFGIMAMTLKRQIGKLGQQEQLMRTILDATPDLVCLLDAGHRYLAVNRAFAAFLGVGEAEIIGRTEADFFPPDEAEERLAKTRAILDSGQGGQAEARVRTARGEQWFHEVNVPVRDASGRVLGVLKTARDVTEVKSIEEKLLQAQKMESLGKLAGGVAHEINTPLGIILGYAQLLQDDVQRDGQVWEDLRIIERQAKVCRTIVADLLGFSRQHESRMGELDLNESVRDVVSLVRHTFGLEKVGIELDLDEALPPITGDSEKMGQVWMNLLNNARDAMPGGGAIRIRTRRDGPEGRLVVSVADNGTGISPEHLGKVFDPFFSTKGVGKGTGLGLSVSFGIVQNHGGTIEAESPAPEGCRPQDAGGPGTVFRVLLPLRPPAQAPAAPPTSPV